jgi:hypothetical protein
LNSEELDITHFSPCFSFSKKQWISLLIVDKMPLFGGWSVEGLFLLVKKYLAAVLHRKAGAGDAFW